MFKVGDRVKSPRGFGVVVCVGNLIAKSLCIEHDKADPYFHNGNPKVTGFEGKAERCFWYDSHNLILAKPVFKGNS